MFVLDTNVLVYAADADSEFHGACRELITRSRDGASAWYLSWGIIYEFLRVSTHPKVLHRPWPVGQALGFVTALLATPSLRLLVPTGRHAEALEDVIDQLPYAAGNLLHDVHTATLMSEHGVRRIYTRDADFHRFPFLEVVDPLGLS